MQTQNRVYLDERLGYPPYILKNNFKGQLNLGFYLHKKILNKINKSLE